MLPPKLILASSSLYRRHLLQKLGIEFNWASPDIDETPQKHESPEQLVLRLSRQKAIALKTKFSQHLIIGADQIATIDNQIIGKPHTYETATRQLQAFSGRKVVFMTGLCLHNSKTGKTQQRLDTYKVTFRNLSNKQIEGYLKKEEPYDCVGSFKSENLGICLFEGMEGKDPNTLIGLPLIELVQLLNNEGVDPLTL